MTEGEAGIVNASLGDSIHYLPMPWFARRGLRVLMYHKISRGERDALTVSCRDLELQMRWLGDQGWPFVTVQQVAREAAGESVIPENAVLVTFDDAYVDTAELAYPILRQFGIPAVVFVPTAFIGQTSAWDPKPEPLMGVQQLCRLSEAGWEIALHSHQHRNFRALSGDEIAADVRGCNQVAKDCGLKIAPAFAYPYGGRPRDRETRDILQRELRAAGLRVGFRIGNRINRMPFRAPFEVNRLGVRGDRSLGAFKRQMRWGRWI